MAASMATIGAGGAWADALHVSPKGNDADPGTLEKPIASIQRAVDLAAARDGAQEIVIHEGVYPGGVKVLARQNPPPLVIHAAQRADGAFEDAILDGSQRITGTTPVAEKPGTFKIPLKISQAQDSSVWEEDTRIRYTHMTAPDAVAQMGASYYHSGTDLTFHTSDGRPPEAHQIAVARDDVGIDIARSRVTVQGLQFRHFQLQVSSAAVWVTSSTEVVIEDCRVWNARRGFQIRPDSLNVKVLRCRADDVGNGVFSYGRNVIVEDCQFFRRAGRFEVPEYSQHQSGVQVYGPGSAAEVRRTLCTGFNLGLFFKCDPGPIIVEHNTIVDTVVNRKVPAPQFNFGIGCRNWGADAIFRYNIVTGYTNVLVPGTNEEGIVPGAVVDFNCLWSAASGDAMIKTLAGRKNGLNNVNVDPQFAAPEKDDYRLRPGSPVAKLAPGDAPIGAFGVLDDKPLQLLPPAKGAISGVAEAASSEAQLPRIAAGFVKHEGPPRAWVVSPLTGSDDPLLGTEEHPLKSLQLALNNANPGDRVVLLPGTYFGPHWLIHGGTAAAPITLMASPKGGVVLDGMKQFDEPCLTIDNAPWVVVKGLEVRWFKAQGILVNESPDVRIEQSLIWNNEWARKERFVGAGIRATKSPRLTVDHCVLYAMNRALEIEESPGFHITYNTVTMTLHHGAAFSHSAAGSVFRDNSFTYTANFHIAVTPAEDVKSFDCDYNNFAAIIRPDEPRRPAPDVDIKLPPDDFYYNRRLAKAVNLLHTEWYYSLKEWQDATGKDTHSIFKHPRYVDPANRDFRLLPDSPNIGAGENGTTIGALGVKQP